MPEQVLVELHEAHLGVNKIKGLGRGYVWGPNMDKVIEELIICVTLSMGMTPINLVSVTHCFRRATYESDVLSMNWCPL